MMLTQTHFSGIHWARQLAACILALCAIATVQAQAAPQDPTTSPAAETQPSASGTPEVSAVDPSRVALGADTTIKITGKNFGEGTKVSFGNPGIRVLSVNAPSGTELTVHIKVAQNADAGATSLYVINPDDLEREVPFEVTAKASTTAAKPKGSAASGSTAEQRFEAYHLGNPAEILQTHGKVKGALVVSAGKLQYEEGTSVLFNVALSEVKEVGVNVIGGFNTGTFHIFLKSGKTYHFAPGSLHPADSQNIVDALQKLLSR